eukprot:7210178-Lingulodinium_polyedra.AAC.1
MQELIATRGRDNVTQGRVVALYMERAPRMTNGEHMTHETFIRECYLINEQVFAVEGVEDCIKKLDM